MRALRVDHGTKEGMMQSDKIKTSIVSRDSFRT